MAVEWNIKNVSAIKFNHGTIFGKLIILKNVARYFPRSFLYKGVNYFISKQYLNK